MTGREFSLTVLETTKKAKMDIIMIPSKLHLFPIPAVEITEKEGVSSCSGDTHARIMESHRITSMHVNM